MKVVDVHSYKSRCVFDCVVLLQAAVSRRGPAFALLMLVEAGRLELLICDEVISELRDVLLRPAVQQRFPLLTAEFVAAYLARSGKSASPIQPRADALPSGAGSLMSFTLTWL